MRGFGLWKGQMRRGPLDARANRTGGVDWAPVKAGRRLQEGEGRRALGGGTNGVRRREGTTKGDGALQPLGGTLEPPSVAVQLPCVALKHPPVTLNRRYTPSNRR